MGGSRKRSARAKEIAAFKAQLGSDGGGIDRLFDQEGERIARAAEEHDAHLRERACERKMRYASRADAEDAVASCAEHGTRGLHVYRCPYCKGWHLTSKRPG